MATVRDAHLQFLLVSL